MTPFVCRERELSRLREFLDLAAAGKGQICFVTGEAGSGKTSLTREFARRAQQDREDLLIAAGNCNAHTGLCDPYLPFREILGLLSGKFEKGAQADTINSENAGRVQRFLGVSKRVIADVGPNLIDMLVPGVGIATRVGQLVAQDASLLKRVGASSEAATGGAAGLSAQANAEKLRIFEQHTAVLRALSRERLLVLILDDLQWIDDSSAALLFHLARRIDESRILIIGSYRPEDVALRRGDLRHPLTQIVSELKREFGEVVIALADAPGGEARGFVDALLDSEPNRLPASFRQELARRTHGHPLFTIELLRAMQDRGDIARNADGHWVEGPALDWNLLPAKVEGAIEERIRRLSEELQELLTSASVEGEIFTAEVLARVARTDARQVVRRLTGDLDRQHGLVRDQGSERAGGNRLSRFRFRHNVIQSYLYGSLGESERELLHEDVAAALEVLHADDTASVAVQLALHFERAKLFEKAVDYYLQAIRRAVAIYAHGEALALAAQAARACDALPKSPARARIELDLKLLSGHALRLSGRWGESMETFRQAAELAERAGAPEALAEAALGYEHPRYRFNLPVETSRGLLARAAAALPPEDSVLRVRILAGLARASMGVEAPTKVSRLVEEAIAMARRLEHPEALLDALEMRFFMDRAPGEILRRLATIDEMVSLARRLEDKRPLIDTLYLRHMERMALGALDVDGFLEEHDRIAGQMREPFYEHNTAVFRVCPAFLAGRFDEAEAFAQRAFEIGREHELGSAEGIYGRHMFTIRREQGRLQEVVPAMQYFLRKHGRAAAWRPGLALIYSDLGRLEEARAEFERIAEDGFDNLPRDALWQTCLVYLAEVCAELGDAARAKQLYALLEPYAQLAVIVGFDFCLGATSRYLGQLAAVLSSWEQAERHFEHALQFDARMDARPWLVHDRFQYGRMLRLRGRPEDAERAARLLEEAERGARELAMSGLLGRLERVAIED